MFKRDKKPEANNVQAKDKKKDLFIQPKLAFGRKGDQYEVEADNMADKVVGNNNEANSIQKKENEEEIQQKPLASEVTPLVQKTESSEEEQPVQSKQEEESIQKKEEKETIQSKCDDCEKEEKVQKQEEEEAVQSKSENNASASNQPSFESKLKGGNGGKKMDGQTKSEMESGFGADFSHVNIHNDSEAAQMSQEIGAQAFTHGNNIYFNEGKYNPNSKEGKHLLAHELTHTIQQKGMVQKKVQKQSGGSGGFDSTISIRHRYLKSREFQVSNGNVTLTSNAQWDRGTDNCGSGNYWVILHEKGIIYDSSYDEKTFSVTRSNTGNWSGLPDGTYYITFHVPSTNPHCVLQGDVSVRT
ncbi:eCIS core domain-containing protein [Tenacibaculum mesophilum]|uniref:eCIS core domain-containing protein n=1 Tax=Tenacibaculum mesophilum TaxID=104268 RepID=UPI003F629CE8